MNENLKGCPKRIKCGVWGYRPLAHGAWRSERLQIRQVFVEPVESLNDRRVLTPIGQPFFSFAVFSS